MFSSGGKKGLSNTRTSGFLGAAGGSTRSYEAATPSENTNDQPQQGNPGTRETKSDRFGLEAQLLFMHHRDSDLSFISHSLIETNGPFPVQEHTLENRQHVCFVSDETPCITRFRHMPALLFCKSCILPPEVPRRSRLHSFVGYT